MGIELNSKLNSYNYNAIDTQNVSEVAKQIFTVAESKTANVDSISQNFDLSKFKRVDLGVEVYGNKINLEKTTQIAVRQAGLDININQGVLSNVQYLNTQAALQANKDLTPNMNGKIQPQVNVDEADSVREVFTLPKSSNVFDIASLNKDKTGSNGSFNFGSNKQKSNESKEETQGLSIFA